MFYLTTHSTHFIYGYMASDYNSDVPRSPLIGLQRDVPRSPLIGLQRDVPRSPLIGKRGLQVGLVLSKFSF